MNIMQMMKQAQGLQKKLQETQKELADLEITGEAANGAVKVICDGQGKFKSTSAEFTRIPQNTIEVTDEKTAINIMRLLSRLEEHDDVQNVYANFDIDDDLMAKIENQI